MADLVKLKIDDIEVQVPKGTLVVDAAKRVGNDIPVFCYHPKLPPVGMCRMCLVEVGRVQRDRATGQVALDENGQPRIAYGPKLETGCTLPVEEGMHIRTANDKVKAGRKDILEFLLTSHPLDCPICDKGGECPLQNLTVRHGPGQSRFIYGEKMHLEKHVPLGTEDDALIYLDRERCIQCARCTRFADEIAGDPVIGFYERGRKLEIVTFSEPGFDSKFSGNTTDICPVGALTTRDFRFGARPWELINSASICPHCPVGCNLHLNTRRSGVSGKFVIKRVMPRQNEQVNEIWICDKGRFGHHFTASPDRLATPLIKKNGTLEEATWDEALDLVASKMKTAGSVSALAGGRLSNEDLFELHKLMINRGGRVRLNSRTGGGDLVQKVGVGVGTNFGAMGNPLARAGGTTIVVVASDLEEEAPIWWLRVKQAAERGAFLIVANARPTKLDKYAHHKVRYAYGDEVNAVNGLADYAAKAENLVVMYGGDGLGLAASTALAQACANLLIGTKHAGKPNNGLIAVWQHANDQGAWDIGLTPSDEMTMSDVMIVAAADPVGDGRQFKSNFLVVTELFLTETAKAADVVLPAQAFTEREGTFTSGERRVQRYYPAVPPVGQSRPDWQIFAQIAERIGQGKAKAAAAAVFAEIAKTVHGYEGLSYQKLAHVEKQFPDVGGADLYYGGTACENTAGLGVQYPTVTERGEVFAVNHVPAGGRPSTDSLVAVPTTLLYDRGATFVRSYVMQPRIPMPYVELNSADAAKLGIADGESVVLAMNGKEMQVTARVNGRAPEGVALVPQSLGGPSLNEVAAASVKKGG
ncbi:MAG: NADH-quinone oxidoreductase subunit NuoG [Chloroflexota bacterium]